jgi:hypothetical protein
MNRQSHRVTDKLMKYKHGVDRITDRCTYSQTDGWMDVRTDRHMDVNIEKQKDVQTYRRKDVKTDRQRDVPTNRHQSTFNNDVHHICLLSIRFF